MRLAGWQEIRFSTTANRPRYTLDVKGLKTFYDESGKQYFMQAPAGWTA